MIGPCRPLAAILLQQTRPYRLILWTIVVLFGAWVLGLLVARLIRLIWSRRYQDASDRPCRSADPVDPWQEAGRRMDVGPTDWPKTTDGTEPEE